MHAELQRFLKCQDGTTAIEYAFIAGLVSIGIIGALSAMSGNITGIFTTISSSLSAAVSA
jgi:pilus assembly protein Flp/PilA